MASDYVVEIRCESVKEVDEPYKTLLYCFEITWSDESKTTKELSSENLQLFRKQLKTEIYKDRPEISLPEVPDGKIGGLVSKAKKAEKRRKHINEFCTQIVNLPHQPGKLQTIRNLFTTTASPDHTPANGQTQQSDDYVQVVPRGPANPVKRSGTLNYVQVEFLHRQKRATKPVVEPIYAEVVLLKASNHPEWLSQADDDSDDDKSEQKNERKSQIASYARSDSDKVPTPPPIVADDEVAEKTEVLVPEEAHEMPDSDESSPKSTSQRPQRTEGTIFDAAMLSNFPEGTLVPLPPNFSPDPCPSSTDLKLNKKGQPPKDDISHVYAVSVCEWKAKGENALSFQRGQKALLLYTSDIWWFISTRQGVVGWVPGDYWRIVTDWKCISGKPSAPYGPWNFGVLDRKECESLLKKGNQQDFLIRESANSTGHLVLSVLHNGKVHHFEVQLTEQGLFYIGQHHFKTLHNVILYYKKKTLFNDEAGNGFRLGRPFVKPKA